MGKEKKREGVEKKFGNSTKRGWLIEKKKEGFAVERRRKELWQIGVLLREFSPPNSLSRDIPQHKLGEKTKMPWFFEGEKKKNKKQNKNQNFFGGLEREEKERRREEEREEKGAERKEKRSRAERVLEKSKKTKKTKKKKTKKSAKNRVLKLSFFHHLICQPPFLFPVPVPSLLPSFPPSLPFLLQMNKPTLSKWLLRLGTSNSSDKTDPLRPFFYKPFFFFFFFFSICEKIIHFFCSCGGGGREKTEKWRERKRGFCFINLQSGFIFTSSPSRSSYNSYSPRSLSETRTTLNSGERRRIGKRQ